jgi:ferrochelatase
MKGVLLMAYGSPSSLEEVEPYYTHIRGGRKPSKEELANLIERYKAIGGMSPLIRITERQRDKLQTRLLREGSKTRVYAGMKHSPPSIADVVSEARSNGVDELLGIALAPHYSKMSIGSYVHAMENANMALPEKMRLDYVPSWHALPALVEVWREKMKKIEKKLPRDFWVVFSAHSLPERILLDGDPYKNQLLQTCELIARKVRHERWSFCFQSAGHTNEPWLGPDILEHLHVMYGKGERSFLIAPIGFVSDHLEILYDIDVECKQWADAHGVKLERSESLNDSDKFIECLYSLVVDKGFQ